LALAPEPWVVYALLGLLLAGLKGYWLYRSARTVGFPQHVHLLSTVVTVGLGMAALWAKPPPVPSSWLFTLCLLSAVAYTLSSVFSAVAQRLLKFDLFNSMIRLASFLPIAYFYFALEERPTIEQWTGICSSALPVVLLTIVTSSSEGDSDARSGLIPLCGAIVSLSALQIINKLAMAPDSAIEPLLFAVGINILAAPVTMGFILIKRDRAPLSSPLLWAGSIAGLLNITSYVCFLSALRTGPASVILPLNAQHIFISTVLSQTFPTRRARIGIGLLAVWVLLSVYLLVRGGFHAG
jgi:drug/metabolite transporter (DMT)-like permease